MHIIVLETECDSLDGRQGSEHKYIGLGEISKIFAKQVVFFTWKIKTWESILPSVFRILAKCVWLSYQWLLNVDITRVDLKTNQPMVLIDVVLTTCWQALMTTEIWWWCDEGLWKGHTLPQHWDNKRIFIPSYYKEWIHVIMAARYGFDIIHTNALAALLLQKIGPPENSRLSTLFQSQLLSQTSSL